MIKKSELIEAIDSHWEKGGVIRVVGLAGSGKTYTLAEAMFHAHIGKRTPLTKIVFVSFTRAAIQEIRHKLKMIMQEVDPNRQSKITFSSAQVATLHSWCWQNLLKSKAQEIKDAGFYSPDQFVMEKRLGEDAVAKLSRALMLDFLGDEEEYNTYIFSTSNPGGLMNHVEEYKFVKGQRLDYNDILDIALAADPLRNEIDLLLVDESQDLTELQWRIVMKHLVVNARVSVVAGDLTQSIYLWNGATPELWLGSPVSTEIIMNESRRIPVDLLPVINSCIADETKWIKVHPENKRRGRVQIVEEVMVYDFLWEKSLSNEEVLVLTLSNSNLKTISNKMIEKGILFARSDTYGKDGFNSIITNDDWHALKFYYALINDPPDTEKTHRDVSSMLRKSPKFRKLWRNHIGIVEGVFGRGEGGLRSYNEKHGNDPITIKELCELGLTPDDFFYDCFAQKKGDDLYLNKRYYSMFEYYERCYQGPYVEPKIKLSTVHGAKGLECGCVILFVASDKRWDKEERLKLYLNAMCRSSSELIITGDYNELFYKLLDKRIPEDWMGVHPEVADSDATIGG